MRRLLALVEDPQGRADLREGRLRFTLASGKHSGEAPYRVPGRVITERQITSAARSGATHLLLDRRAVLTPLAKDKIRALGLTVERDAGKEP